MSPVVPPDSFSDLSEICSENSLVSSTVARRRLCSLVVVILNDQKSGMPLDLEEYSVTNLRNVDDLSSRSRVGVSNSATRPARTETESDK